MVYRKKTTYRRKKFIRRRRTFRRGRSDGGKITALRTSLVPDRMLVRLNWEGSKNLSAVSTSTFAVTGFRLNSIYDPDLSTGVGQYSALGYSRWSQFYNKYRVYKAMVTATFINNQNGGVRCLLLPYNTPTSIYALDDSSFMQPWAKSKTVGGSQGVNKVVIKQIIDLPRLNGRSHSQYRSSDITASQMGYNPSELANLAIGVLDLGTNSPTVQCFIKITYFVELFDRQTLSLSDEQHIVEE